MKPRDIKLHRSAKTRQIRFSIKSDLTLLISAPLYSSASLIEALLLKHQRWIEEQTQKIFLKNQEQRFLLERFKGKILVFGEWRERDLYDAKMIKKLLMEYIQTRALAFCELMGVQFQSIGIRCNKRVLGSCSFDHKLSFSLLLFFASYEEIDYVIVHELAHITHKNHSKDFWNLVGKFCGDFKKNRAKLHQNIGLYHLLYEQYFT